MKAEQIFGISSAGLSAAKLRMLLRAITADASRSTGQARVKSRRATLLGFLGQRGDVERSCTEVSGQTNNADGFWRSRPKCSSLKTTRADGPYLISGDATAKQACHDQRWQQQASIREGDMSHGGKDGTTECGR